MLVCLSKPIVVKLWHSVCVCVFVYVCVCFVERVHGPNECMCCVRACVCVFV